MVSANRSSRTEADTEFQKSQMDWVPQMTEIDDLRGPLPSSFVPLTIPCKYFDLTVATGELTKKGVVPTPRSALQVVPGFVQQVSGFWFQRTFDPPELSYKILGDITQNMVRRQHKMGMTADQYIVHSFPQAMREELTTHMATGNELLHHIWASYPLNFHTSSGESGSTKGCNVRNLQMNLGFQRGCTIY
jgi:hypothetical protein